MEINHHKKYFYYSLFSHIAVIALLIMGFDTTTPMPVVENANTDNVINAVALGDTQKSKVMPIKLMKSTRIEKPEPQPLAPPKPQPVEVKKDVIALKIEKKKKLVNKKAVEEKRLHELMAKDLLADIQKHHEKQKKIKQDALKSQFEKMLKEQAEKTLRQQLLNEDIRLQGEQTKLARGEVNKYKALILQVISQHWLIPTHANKKVYCELLIRLAPGGMVLDVQISKSSGDSSLDSSARAAVLKSSPLPVPANANAFEAFRQFVLKVKPENVLANDAA